MKKYPELEKLTEHNDFICNVLEFTGHCEVRGIWLLDTKTEKSVNPVDVVWELLGIDKVEVEKQRQQLIKDELQGQDNE